VELTGLQNLDYAVVDAQLQTRVAVAAEIYLRRHDHDHDLGRSGDICTGLSASW
jgi:hypothetical protein